MVNLVGPKQIEECAICQEPLSDNTTTTPCNHTFDSKCINQWILTKSDSGARDAPCPLCRKIIYVQNSIDPDFALIHSAARDIRRPLPAAARRIANIPDSRIPLPQRVHVFVEDIFRRQNSNNDNLLFVLTREIERVFHYLDEGFTLSDDLFASLLNKLTLLARVNQFNHSVQVLHTNSRVQRSPLLLGRSVISIPSSVYVQREDDRLFENLTSQHEQPSQDVYTNAPYTNLYNESEEPPPLIPDDLAPHIDEID